MTTDTQTTNHVYGSVLAAITRLNRVLYGKEDWNATLELVEDARDELWNITRALNGTTPNPMP